MRRIGGEWQAYVKKTLMVQRNIRVSHKSVNTHCSQMRTGDFGGRDPVLHRQAAHFPVGTVSVSAGRGGRRDWRQRDCEIVRLGKIEHRPGLLVEHVGGDGVMAQ